MQATVRIRLPEDAILKIELSMSTRELYALKKALEEKVAYGTWPVDQLLAQLGKAISLADASYTPPRESGTHIVGGG